MSIWQLLFSVIAYLSAALCVASALAWISKTGVAMALCELFTFLLFVLAYWLFESWATYLTSYYSYAVFWDQVPYFDWSVFAAQPWMPTPYKDPICPPLPDVASGIPLSVPVMEAALTYAMMWTARLLAPTLVLLQPFLVGVASLVLDLLLDPVSATRFDCVTHVQLGSGLGFWDWQVHDGLGLRWFAIPLFNFAAWFSVPIALTALALLLKWLCDVLRWLLGKRAGGQIPQPSLIDGALRAIIFFAYTLLFAIAPSNPSAIHAKEWLMAATVLATLVAIYQLSTYFVRTNPWRWEFILPQLLFHGFALAALLLSGLVPLFPLLWVAIVLVAIGIYYAISPHA